jgi:hypothetical protein
MGMYSVPALALGEVTIALPLTGGCNHALAFWGTVSCVYSCSFVGAPLLWLLYTYIHQQGLRWTLATLAGALD